MKNTSKYFDEIIRASDVADRDGIGVEFYKDKKLVLEIFRDDTLKSRTVTFCTKDLPLEIVEESIKIFKESIDWKYMEYE